MSAWTEWAVFSSNGHLVRNTTRKLRFDAQQSAVERFGVDWRRLKLDGFRVLPVTVERQK